MQDVCKHPICPAQRPREGVGDGAKDEAPGGQFRQVGKHRRHQIAKIQLAGFDKLTHGVFGRGEGRDQSIADVAANVAGLGGIVRKGGDGGFPSGFCDFSACCCGSTRDRRPVDPGGPHE